MATHDIEDAEPVPAQGGMAGAVARGDVARVEWVRSGEVVTTKALSGAWRLTPRVLASAAQRGELFAVTVHGRRYYPSEFLKLDRSDVGTVCAQLQALDPSEKLVFWKRQHGQLGGHTVFEALSNNQLAQVVQLAQALTAQIHAS